MRKKVHNLIALILGMLLSIIILLFNLIGKNEDNSSKIDTLVLQQKCLISKEYYFTHRLECNGKEIVEGFRK